MTNNTVFEKENKTAIVTSRTFGGFRVVLMDSYFEKQEEFFFESRPEALNYVDKWLTKD